MSDSDDNDQLTKSERWKMPNTLTRFEKKHLALMLNSMLDLCKIYCIYRCSLEKKVAFPSHKCCAVLWGNASTIKGGLVFLAAQISLHLQPPTLCSIETTCPRG